MTLQSIPENAAIKCPRCRSEVAYRYGKSRMGKQRFLCLICGRQFVPGSKKTFIQNKPHCPRCDRLMHVYKRGLDNIRYRCSGYPECREYVKEQIAGSAKEEEEEKP